MLGSRPTMDDAFNPHPPTAPGDGQDSWQEVMGGFPRHLTTQLIDDRTAERSRKQGIAVWLVAVSLTLFALAWPQERLLGTLPIEGWRGIGLGNVGWPFLAVELGKPFGLGVEAMGLLLAAIGYGLCLPVALSIARQLGMGLRLALPTCLLALLSPGAWTAATSPGLGTLGLLFGLLLMRELWREGPSRVTRILGYWTLAATLDVGFAWTLPAVLLALRFRGSVTKGTRKDLLGLVMAIGIAVYLFSLGLLAGMAQGAPPLYIVVRAYLLDLAGNWSTPLAWAAVAVPTVGVAFAGLAGLVLVRRDEAESAPPRWLFAWCLVPAAVFALCGPVPFGFSYLWLLPPALIGCLDLIARQEEPVAAAWIAGAVACTGIVLAATLWFVSSNDPLTAWRTHAQAFLEPDDLVLTTEPRHLYLLEARWGLEADLIEPGYLAEELAARVTRETASGRRILLDLAQEDPTPGALHKQLEPLPRLQDLQPTPFLRPGPSEHRAR